LNFRLYYSRCRPMLISPEQTDRASPRLPHW
jgi:hypothetical protein